MKGKDSKGGDAPGDWATKTTGASAIAFLRKKEWSMGHGQCDECCGVNPALARDPHWASDEFGHEKTCDLAKSLESIGQSVVYKYTDEYKKRWNSVKWSRFMGPKNRRKAREKYKTFVASVVKQMAERFQTEGGPQPTPNPQGEAP